MESAPLVTYVRIAAVAVSFRHCTWVDDQRGSNAIEVNPVQCQDSVGIFLGKML